MKSDNFYILEYDGQEYIDWFKEENGREPKYYPTSKVWPRKWALNLNRYIGNRLDVNLVELMLTPCINVCKLNNKGICIGCKRTREEIANWTRMSDEERRRIMEKNKNGV